MIKTKNTELNDEFVLLRKFVRQARVHVINKLTRRAKELRATSDEKRRRTKTKRNEAGKDDEQARKSKAERLLREVFALKRIKDVEISKFGIVNFEKLQSILQSPSSDDGTRAMVKIVLHKSLNPKIAALRDKFPECDQYISEKEAVTERTNGTTDGSRRPSERTTVGDDAENVQKRMAKNVEKVRKRTVNDVNRVAVTNDDDVREPPKKKKRRTDEAAGRETENVGHSVKRSKAPETGTESTKSDSGTVAKIISREATVKRFTEILKGPEPRVDEPETSKDRNTFRTEEKEGRDESVDDQLFNETEEADDFFLNSNKTVPRSVPEEKHTDDVHDVGYDQPYPTSKRKKFHDGKESRSEKWNKERSKGVRHDRSDAHEANGARRGNRRATPNEKRESDKSMNVENEDLHPSWAAKKKQQDILKQGFQGKKIKFDED